MQTNASEQSKMQSLLYEPIRKLSKSLFDSELQSVYNKFIELGNSLNDNLKSFVSKKIASREFSFNSILFTKLYTDTRNKNQIFGTAGKSAKN